MSDPGGRKSTRRKKSPAPLWQDTQPVPKKDTRRRTARVSDSNKGKSSLLNKGQQTAKGKAEKLKEKVKSVKQKARKVKVISNFQFIPFLSKLAQLKADASVLAKIRVTLLNENRLALFGGLPEPITRGEISEPYNAGSIQGPVLYGVGTGKPAPANITTMTQQWPQGRDFSTYVDTVILNLMATAGKLPPEYHLPSTIPIPRCWGTGIPVTFGQGKTQPEWPWDKAGGGTNHEMEHAIKCILQAMLNFLSQSNTEDDRTMHVLLKTFFISILGEGDSDKAQMFADKITKLLRKQQVIAGLPSCALFNQFKCGLDLIKVELKQIPGQGWFYVEVSANMDVLNIVSEGVVTPMNVFTLLAKKMKGAKSQSGKMEQGKYNPKGGCNFYGMEMPDDENKDGSVRHRSAWGVNAGSDPKARLDLCYRTVGGKHSDSPSVHQMINDDDIYAAELEYSYSLKNMPEDQLANLMLGRTNIVCEQYNKISKIPVIGQMLSGITLAASLMMLSISMGRVLESDADLKTSKDPQLYKLGSKATGFLTRLATTPISPGGISYMERFLTDTSIDADRAAFLAKVSNPVTRGYLEAPLVFGQGGGALDIKIDQGGYPPLKRVVSYAGDAPTSPNAGKPMDRGGTMMSTQPFTAPTQESYTGLELFLDDVAEGGVAGVSAGPEEVDMGQSNVLSPENIALLASLGIDAAEDDFLENEALFLDVAEGGVAEVSAGSEEVYMGQSNVLSPENIALLTRLEDSPENEFKENVKLFYEVESLLSKRYDGLEDVFSRILDGDDKDGLVYYDQILKNEEVEISQILNTAGYKKKETARKKKKETARKKKAATRKKRKEPTCKKAGQTKKRKRRRTVKKDSLYQRLLKRLGF